MSLWESFDKVLQLFMHALTLGVGLQHTAPMHTHGHTHARTHTQAHIYRHMHAYTHADTCTHTHMRTHARIHTCGHVHRHTHTRTRARTHTHADTCTGTHTHTDTHTGTSNRIRLLAYSSYLLLPPTAQHLGHSGGGAVPLGRSHVLPECRRGPVRV